MPEFAARPEPERDHARLHYFNVVRKIDFGLVAMKRGRNERISVSREMEEAVVAEFDSLLKARLPCSADGGTKSR